MLYKFGLHTLSQKQKFYLKLNNAQDIFDSSDEPNERTPVRINF